MYVGLVDGALVADGIVEVGVAVSCRVSIDEGG